MLQTVNENTHAVISTEEELEEASAPVKKLLQKAKKLGVHVVEKEFLKELDKGLTLDSVVVKHSIGNWGTDAVSKCFSGKCTHEALTET